MNYSNVVSRYSKNGGWKVVRGVKRMWDEENLDN